MNLTEKEILTDYIISTYNMIDYPRLIRYYGSYQQMLTAFHSNTGSEYDILERIDSTSDLIFSKMTRYVQTKLCHSNLSWTSITEKDVKQVLLLKEDEKVFLAEKLLGIPGSSAKAVAKFLHIDTQFSKYRKV